MQHTLSHKFRHLKKVMKSTCHKCVLNAMTAPNPTQYTKFGKYLEKHTNRDWSEICPKSDFVLLFAIPGGGRRGKCLRLM